MAGRRAKAGLEGHGPRRRLTRTLPWSATACSPWAKRVTANFAIALDRTSGKKPFGRPTSAKRRAGLGGFAGPRCTPTVDGDLVFAVGQYGEVACLDCGHGQERWRKNYVKDFGGKVPEWGFAGMPVVDGANVILMPGGKSGRPRSLAEGERRIGLAEQPAHRWHPLFIADGGRDGRVRQYIQLTDASVAGIRRRGRPPALAGTGLGRTAVIPTPIVQAISCT